MEKDIKKIIANDLSGVISIEDSRLLQEWLDLSEENQREYAKMRDVMALNGALSCEVSNKKEIYQKISGRKRRLRQYVYGISSAAAVIALFIGLLSIDDKSKESHEIEKAVAVAQHDDVLFISNGNAYKIDSNVQKIDLGSAEIHNNSEDKMVAFKANDHSEAIVENKIIVPAGRIYKVMLPDGTQVTLNAKSTLTFPSRFEAENRVVVLNGEALFDVTHNPDRPFVVKSNKSEVRVFGTVFNVNAYDGDSVNIVSLISGVVVTGNGEVEKKLKPGEQATVESRKQIQVVPFNVDEVLSWQRLEFFFDDKPLGDVVSAIEHWYGVKIKFMNDNLKNVRAYVKVEKSTSLNELLELIAATNKVRFEFIEKGIFVYPNE